jgi:hypothetical protein
MEIKIGKRWAYFYWNWGQIGLGFCINRHQIHIDLFFFSFGYGI